MAKKKSATLKTLNKALSFVLAVLPIAAVGGFFTGIYAFEELTPDLQTQVLETLGRKELLYVTTMIQTCVYAIMLGIVGYFLAEKLGLMKPFRFEKKGIKVTAVLTLITGLVLGTDNFFFGKYIPQVGKIYESKPDLAYWISSVLYGGVIEEIMMRLFVMSLIALILWKLFSRKNSTVPETCLIIANIIAALLFAAGHLPATLQMFGEITPIMLIRCFLLNSFGGICFGYLYRRHGIHYAMLAHGGAHIVWKVLWVLFI